MGMFVPTTCVDGGGVPSGNGVVGMFVPTVESGMLVEGGKLEGASVKMNAGEGGSVSPIDELDVGDEVNGVSSASTRTGRTARISAILSFMIGSSGCRKIREVADYKLFGRSDFSQVLAARLSGSRLLPTEENQSIMLPRQQAQPIGLCMVRNSSPTQKICPNFNIWRTSRTARAVLEHKRNLR